MKFTKIFLALCFCTLMAAPALAQSTIATVTGTVTDSSGAIVPGASVIAENTKTGVKTTVTTNDSGIYLFASLTPGITGLPLKRPGSAGRYTTRSSLSCLRASPLISRSKSAN